MGQGGQELGLTFGSNNPVAREIQEVTGIVTKKGLGSETGALPLYVHFHPHGKGCRELEGQGGEQREGPGSVFGLCPHKGFSAPY